jgi:hypothetical protein
MQTTLLVVVRGSAAGSCARKVCVLLTVLFEAGTAYNVSDVAFAEAQLVFKFERGLITYGTW